MDAFQGAFLLMMAMLLGLVLVTFVMQREPRERFRHIQFQSKPLMSSIEQAFYYRLRDAFPDALIFSRVNLKQLISPRLQGRRRRQVLAKLEKLTCDFVICSKNSAVLAVIELEDREHPDPVTRRKVARKNQVLNAAGIRFIHYDISGMPSVDNLRSFITIIG